MSWVTVIWSMSAAVSLTLAAIHLAVWAQNRKSWVNLTFSLTALVVAWIAASELRLIHADTVAEFGSLIRWLHLPLFLFVVGLTGFVGLYLGTGRWWLAALAVGVRLLSLAVNFSVHPNVNYREVTALKQVNFLGDRVWVLAQSVPNPWRHLAELSSLLVLLFVLDAAIRLWRRGDGDARRRALVVGGSISLFILAAAGMAALIQAGVLHTPSSLSLPFLAIVVAMGYELSRDVIRAGRLAEELRENADGMALAASAARLALWRWDILRDAIWFNADGRRLLGFAAEGELGLEQFIEAIHPDDRAMVRQAVRHSLEGEGDYRMEFRLVLPGGAVRWIAGRGTVEFNVGRQPIWMRGVSIDITERRTAELEAVQHRTELAHLTRVTTLGQLSGSLAHELNQPLGIILSNAQAAQELLAQDPPDLAEVQDILSDIVAADRRAGQVIERLRALLKRGDTALLPLPLNAVIEEVLRLTRAELIGRGVTVVHDLAPDLPQVTGDRVQLQQLVLNLILNAADAMSTNAPGTRRLHITATFHQGNVRTSVRDEGVGLPEDIERLFQPFVTTKPQGLGMGLAICRSMIAAHHGRLWAERHPERGAVFHFELPRAVSEAKP